MWVEGACTVIKLDKSREALPRIMKFSAIYVKGLIMSNLQEGRISGKSSISFPTLKYTNFF